MFPKRLLRLIAGNTECTVSVRSGITLSPMILRIVLRSVVACGDFAYIVCGRPGISTKIIQRKFGVFCCKSRKIGKKIQ